MRVDDQTKVTNAIAAAIEYITKLHNSSLSAIVVRELRSANAIVSVAARREIETLPTPELEAVAHRALDTLRLRRGEEFASRRDANVVIARELSYNLPRISTETYDPTAPPTPRPERQGVYLARFHFFLLNPGDMAVIGGGYQDLDEALAAATADAEALAQEDTDLPPVLSYWVVELAGVATYTGPNSNERPEMVYAAMR